MNLLRNEWRYGDQDQIKFVAQAGHGSGDVVVVGSNVIGIALVDIATGETGNIATSGVWEMTKGTGDIAVGVPVYWDTTNKVVTTTAGTNPWLGVTVPKSEPAFENTCYVQLRQKTVAVS